MSQRLGLAIILLAAARLLAADGDPIVFRSDVALARVDAQVLDRNNRAVTGLAASDFVLLDEGQPRQIRNFTSEDMPADVLLLLDVSGSMRTHLERIASAARDALAVLGPEDRVAIMVFDRAARMRMPFRDPANGVERELDLLLRQETFDGGTDITRALLAAADQVSRDGRREARRAIVIVTDDRTERERDEEAVSRALVRADAVLFSLLAPDAMRRLGVSGPWGGGGRGPLGGVIIGRRRGPIGAGSRTQSAGTAEIARRSGGDSMSVNDGSAFADTLARVRRRYALHFYLPQGARPGQERAVEVELSDAARRRHPDAEVRYRRVYLAPGARAANPDPGFKPRPNPEGGWRRVQPGEENGSQQPDPPPIKR